MLANKYKHQGSTVGPGSGAGLRAGEAASEDVQSTVTVSDSDRHSGTPRTPQGSGLGTRAWARLLAVPKGCTVPGCFGTRGQRLSHADHARVGDTLPRPSAQTASRQAPLPRAENADGRLCSPGSLIGPRRRDPPRTGRAPRLRGGASDFAPKSRSWARPPGYVAPPMFFQTPGWAGIGGLGRHVVNGRGKPRNANLRPNLRRPSPATWTGQGPLGSPRRSRRRRGVGSLERLGATAPGTAAAT